MYGATQGSLEVKIVEIMEDGTTINSTIWTQSGDQGDNWIYQQVCATNNSVYQQSYLCLAF